MKSTLFATVAILATCLSLQSSAAPGDLAVTLEGPPVIRPGRSFRIIVHIRNESTAVVVYRHHWKWAKNTMYLQAKGEDGNLVESKPLLLDIDSASTCLYFKPLLPGESFSFSVLVNNEFGVDLNLPTAWRSAEITWKYVPGRPISQPRCTSEEAVSKKQLSSAPLTLQLADH